MNTITVNGVTYDVTYHDDHDGQMPYELHGPRGAHYGLMRNIPRPHMLFMVNLRHTTYHTPDVWFTDKHGHLEVC